MAIMQIEPALLEGAPLPTEDDLPYDDGVPLESDWHRAAMNLLIDSVDYYWKDRDDFYVGGNMFVYYDLEHARDRNFRGPDFFVVKGVPRHPLRKSWVVWQEGRAPDVIVELVSPSTAVEDRTVKKDIYERTLKTSDYFCYDPDSELLEGWHLVDGVYVALPVSREGRIWSEELNAFIGPWSGVFRLRENVWLRLFDRRGRLLPNFDEAAIARADKEAANARAMQAERDREAARAEKEAANARAMQAERDREAAHAREMQAERDREAARAEKEAANARTMQVDRDREAARAEKEAANARAMQAELDRLREQLAGRTPVAE